MHQTGRKIRRHRALLLRIDGKVIIDRTCHISISGDGRASAMIGIAEVSVEAELPTARLMATSAEQKNAHSRLGTGDQRGAATTEEEVRTQNSKRMWSRSMRRLPARTHLLGQRTVLYVLFGAVPDLRP